MSWRDGGCPITNFVIQFKPKSQPEWILLSSHILPEQETVLIRDLNPGSWHDLLVLAKNEAGTTEANFMFATLTRNGATIAPMLLSDHGFMGSGGSRSLFETVMVLVPSLCAIIVLSFVGLVVIYMLICKKRLDDSHGDHCTFFPSSLPFFWSLFFHGSKFFPSFLLISHHFFLFHPSFSILLFLPLKFFRIFVSPSFDPRRIFFLPSSFLWTWI